MPTATVIDASLVAAFLLREPSGKKLDPLLQQLAGGAQTLHVPTLFAFEMTNILLMAQRRKRIKAADVEGILSEWEQIPMQEDAPPTPSTRRRILSLAQKHKLTAYDAAYVELAQRLDAGLVSLDRDILRLKKTFRWIS